MKSKRVVLERHISRFPDFESFAKSSLCPCPWRGESDATCRAMFHTIYRIPENTETPQRLAPYHYAGCNRAALHLWKIEDHISRNLPVDLASDEILSMFSTPMPRRGLEFSLRRDWFVGRLPTSPEVRANTILIIRATLAGDVAFEVIPPAEKYQPRVPDPPGFEWSGLQVVHRFTARLIWDALLGVQETFRMWLPEEPYVAATIEGDSTRTVLMPLDLSRPSG